MSGITLTDVGLDFGDTRAVDQVTLDVPKGAFLALLGPSGCGKTTLLRLLAGLERPTRGKIEIDGEVMAEAGHFLPPEARNLGMVFQSYALWPHMSVAGNIRFGLRLKKLPRPEEESRIKEALDMVGLAAMAHRKPHELSGGQRQRVALARSLAMRPRLILLDEPLANLDAHLRSQMLKEFRRIHDISGTGFVFVTHDQDEAMAVATHIAVMNAGRIAQISSPEDLYHKPQTEMVARFVGSGRTMPVEVLHAQSGMCAIRLQDRILHIKGDAPQGPGWLCLRAPDLRLSESGPLIAIVSECRFLSGAFAVTAQLKGLEAEFSVSLPRPVERGEEIRLELSGGWILPRESERCVA